MMHSILVAAFATICVSCATTPTFPTAQFQKTDDDYSLADFLESSNITMQISTDGTVELQNTPVIQEALSRYLHMTLTRRDVIENNIANLDTPRYFRRKVVLSSGGDFEVISVPRTGLPRFLKYEQAHPIYSSKPSTDWVPAGYVEYPEIDPEIEMTDLDDARTQFVLASELLRRFDPTFPLATWSSYPDEVIPPPNAYVSSTRQRLDLPDPKLLKVMNSEGEKHDEFSK